MTKDQFTLRLLKSRLGMTSKDEIIVQMMGNWFDNPPYLRSMRDDPPPFDVDVFIIYDHKTFMSGNKTFMSGKMVDDSDYGVCLYLYDKERYVGDAAFDFENYKWFTTETILVAVTDLIFGDL